MKTGQEEGEATVHAKGAGGDRDAVVGRTGAEQVSKAANGRVARSVSRRHHFQGRRVMTCPCYQQQYQAYHCLGKSPLSLSSCNADILFKFQNKRQESKKHAKEQQEQQSRVDDAKPEQKGTKRSRDDEVDEQTLPTPSSRAGKGSYDPSTGKWRPVPAYLIASAQHPPAAKCDAVLAIANGELSRDEFLAGGTLGASPCSPQTPSSSPRPWSKQ